MEFDIGTFTGTRAQYDNLISDGTTVGYFVEIIGVDRLVHVSDAVIGMEDCTEYLQGASDLASSISIIGSGRASVKYPNVDMRTSESIVFQPKIKEKSNIQDRQHFYRNNIVK